MQNKEKAAAFLTLAASDKVDEAYDTYIHPNFRHHNVHFPGDRASLYHGMKESAERFPLKEYRTVRTLEDDDLVAVHGRIRIAPGAPEIALIHIFRFEDGLIIEEWEAGQEVPEDSPNTNGAF